MLKLLVVVIIQYILLHRNTSKKGGWKNPSSLIFLIYFIAAALSIPHILINGDSGTNGYYLVFQDKYWLGTIAFIFYIILFLLPFLLFDESKVSEIRLPSLQILNIFSTVIIVLSLYSIVFYLPSVIRMFTSGAALSSLRNNLGTIRTEYVNTSGIGNTIASVASSMYPFAALLFFIYYILGNSPIRCFLLFISSTSNIIAVLSFVGRDGVVFWVLTIVFMFFVFGSYLSIKQRGKIKLSLMIGAIISIIPFMAISISRFGSNSEEFGTLKAILSYMGQMVPNYLLYFDVRSNHFNYGIGFPLFWEITRQKPPTSLYWSDGGTNSNVFATFIKGYNINFGLLGTVIVGIIALAFFVTVFRKKNNRLCFHQYFIYILYFQILSEGVFYFREYTRGGNLFILICILFYFIFEIIEQRFGFFILQKNGETEEIINRRRIRFKIKR